jgi:uncharacterized protein (DUF427 family)
LSKVDQITSGRADVALVHLPWWRDIGRMATHVSSEFTRGLEDLRYEPTAKRVRARTGGRTLVDSRAAMIVWEPRRIVPSYAVPSEDIDARLVPAADSYAEAHPVAIDNSGPRVLDPRTGFAAHTCDGQPLSFETDGSVFAGAGFRPADADLSGYVVLDFDAFDEWLEEDEPIVGHPHDPFSRIDIRRSSDRVQIEIEGVVVADTTSARLLFETHITPRFYLPRDDVRMDMLTASSRRTVCAYKGFASYWSAVVNGRIHSDVAWTYENPLIDATDVTGLIAFFDERVDVIRNGERRARPVTPWS